MKKIKSPWYGVVWIVVWTAALIWFLSSGRFNDRESIALLMVWFILVGITVYLIVQHVRIQLKREPAPTISPSRAPSLNAACPCGSGKKYKRCCGVSNQ